MSFGDGSYGGTRHAARSNTIEANDALMQCSTHPEIEGMFGGKKWTVYRHARSIQQASAAPVDVVTNKTYIRLTSEFNDGRFERVEG